jgi:hypothetical protein
MAVQYSEVVILGMTAMGSSHQARGDERHTRATTRHDADGLFA